MEHKWIMFRFESHPWDLVMYMQVLQNLQKIQNLKSSGPKHFR
jgi:hypothetical protein